MQVLSSLCCEAYLLEFFSLPRCLGKGCPSLTYFKSKPLLSRGLCFDPNFSSYLGACIIHLKVRRQSLTQIFIH